MARARTAAGTGAGIADVTAAGSTPDIDVTTAGTLTGQQPRQQLGTRPYHSDAEICRAQNVTQAQTGNQKVFGVMAAAAPEKISLSARQPERKARETGLVGGRGRSGQG